MARGYGSLLGLQALSRRKVGVVGVDDDMRARFFGAEASTAPTRARLE